MQPEAVEDQTEGRNPALSTTTSQNARARSCNSTGSRWRLVDQRPCRVLGRIPRRCDGRPAQRCAVPSTREFPGRCAPRSGRGRRRAPAAGGEVRVRPGVENRAPTWTRPGGPRRVRPGRASECLATAGRETPNASASLRSLGSASPRSQLSGQHFHRNLVEDCAGGRGTCNGFGTCTDLKCLLVRGQVVLPVEHWRERDTPWPTSFTVTAQVRVILGDPNSEYRQEAHDTSPVTDARHRRRVRSHHRGLDPARLSGRKCRRTVHARPCRMQQ